MMTSKTCKVHADLAKKMGWCGLAEVIIEYERSLYEMKPYLDKKDFEEICKTVEIYEKEKMLRIEAQTKRGYDKWL